MIRFTFDSSEAHDALARIAAHAPQWARAIERQAAEATLAVSRELVPVKTGRLRDSLHQEDDPMGGVALVADTPYAREVHEDDAMPHPNGGQAGFLRQPLYETGLPTLLALAQQRFGELG
jgi:hypothetical protein